MSQPEPPYRRVEFVNAPAIVGARWWNNAVLAAPDATRRNTLIALGIGAAVVAAGTVGMAGIGALVVAGSAPDEDDIAKDALELQRRYGWSFGSNTEPLTFDGIATSPFDRATLESLPFDLAPAQAALKPYYQPALFQSAWESPKEQDPTSASPTAPLRDALVPIFTPAMNTAYARGRALASLFDGLPPETAVIVDLPGPESVAFAAGMAERFDPVFTFDNWPHPRCVVPAHLTLAAACYYRPLFVRVAASKKSPAAPVFVLDRSRLAPYTEDIAHFDNRYVAKLPSGEALRALGVKQVLYVAQASDPGTIPVELDDLNVEFVAYESAGVDVKTTSAEDFRAKEGGATHYYGGSEETHPSFWDHYVWYSPPKKPGAIAAVAVSRGFAYQPTARSTLFGPASATVPTKPAGFGAVWVSTSRSTGQIVRCNFGRSGSWSRSSGGG